MESGYDDKIGISIDRSRSEDEERKKPKKANYHELKPQDLQKMMKNCDGNEEKNDEDDDDEEEEETDDESYLRKHDQVLRNMREKWALMQQLKMETRKDSTSTIQNTGGGGGGNKKSTSTLATTMTYQTPSKIAKLSSSSTDVHSAIAAVGKLSSTSQDKPVPELKRTPEIVIPTPKPNTKTAATPVPALTAPTLASAPVTGVTVAATPIVVNSNRRETRSKQKEVLSTTSTAPPTPIANMETDLENPPPNNSNNDASSTTSSNNGINNAVKNLLSTGVLAYNNKKRSYSLVNVNGLGPVINSSSASSNTSQPNSQSNNTLSATESTSGNSNEATPQAAKKRGRPPKIQKQTHLQYGKISN